MAATSGNTLIVSGGETLPTNISLDEDTDYDIYSDDPFFSSDSGDVNGDGTNDLIITSVGCVCCLYILRFIEHGL